MMFQLYYNAAYSGHQKIASQLLLQSVPFQAMRKSRHYWGIALLLLLLPALAYGWERWRTWNALERNIVWDRWTVNLPQGGTLTYLNQSPQSRLMGPADTSKLLLWRKADGSNGEYLIADIGGGYEDLEWRIRPDNSGVWLISWDWKQVVATLDLKSGRFTAGGVIYDSDGLQNMDLSGDPTWAKLSGGRSLGRRKF